MPCHNRTKRRTRRRNARETLFEGGIIPAATGQVQCGDLRLRVAGVAAPGPLLRRIGTDHAAHSAGCRAVARLGEARWQLPAHRSERNSGYPGRRGSELITLDDAPTALAVIDSRKARVIELRFFGGLSVEETAAVLA